jgi:hypothetical protein
VLNASRAYSQWSEVREPFLRRARDSARLTIPSLVPPKGNSPHSDLPTPFQGLGAQGVNNLASKLLLSLFPPTQPFFRLVPTDPEQLRAAGERVQGEVEEGLVRMERVVASEFETMALRVKLFEALKHLLVAGNVALHLQPDGSSRVLTLDQYVCRRDPMGWLECLIVKECLDRDQLPPKLRELVARRGSDGYDPIPLAAAESDNASATRSGYSRDVVSLFTCVEWDAETNKYRLHQEIEGQPVPDMVGSYKPNLMPFRVLRYSTIDGEDYGRGMVEEIIGDLISLEGLMRAIVEAAAIASRMVGLVDPAGAATADDLNRAPNGAFVVGRATDVTYPQVNKGGDLQVALTTKVGLEERLSRAFLLNTAVQRQAERVTAEEIRFVAQELESTLGGVFSVLSQELQLPLVELIRDRLAKQRKIRRLPERSVRAAIVTGIEALGRGQELARLQVAAQVAAGIVGPERLNEYINVRVLLGAVFSASGVDTTTGLIRSEQEVAQAAQQAQMMAMAQHLGPDVIKQAGPGVVQRMGLGVEQSSQTPPPPATPAS